MAISERLDRLNPHFWRRRELRYEQEDWSRIASRFDSGPDDEAEAPEFAAAVSSAVEANLIHLPQMHRLGALPPPMGAHVLLGLQHLTHRPVDRTTRGGTGTASGCDACASFGPAGMLDGVPDLKSPTGKRTTHLDSSGATGSERLEPRRHPSGPHRVV